MQNIKVRILYLIKPLLIALATMLPFILLLFFAFPQTDDYAVASAYRELNLWEGMCTYHMQWSGRYAANFLILISTYFIQYNPFHYSIALIFPFFGLIVMFIIGMMQLFKINNLEHQWMPTAIGLFLFFALSPSTAEGFYWVMGLTIYTLPCVLFILFSSLLLSTSINSKKKQRITLVCLSFLLAGFSELIWVAVLGILIYGLFLNLTTGKNFSFQFKALLILVFFAGVCLSAFAPGNFVRAETIGLTVDSKVNLEKLLHLSLAFKEGILWLKNVLFHPVFLLGSLILLYHLKNMQLSFSSRNLILSLILLILIPCLQIYLLMLLKPYTGLSGRVEQLLFITFLFFWFLLLQNLSPWFSRINTLRKLGTNPNLNLIIFSLILLVIFTPNSLKTAYFDLFSGNANKYMMQHKERHELLISSSSTHVTLELIKNNPKSLFVADIDSDSLNWKNEVLAKYYQKEYVTGIVLEQ